MLRSSLCFISPRVHLVLHSFPTRRSSDLLALGPVGRAPRARARQGGAGQSRSGGAVCAGPRVAPARGCGARGSGRKQRSEEHTSELQSHVNLVCRLLLEKKKIDKL